MKSFFLRLIHYAIALGEFLHNLIFRLPLIAMFAFPKKSATTVREDIKQLKKIPTHLGILLEEEDLSLKDVANIIVWAVALGIPYISVYDMNGELKRNSQSLQKNVEQSKKEVQSYDQSVCDIQIYSSSQAVIDSNTTDSFHQCKARVKLVCMEDGQRNIVNIAQHVSKMVSSGSCRREDINPATIDCMFQETSQFPDPEMCVKFGRTDCLFGYLPWQIRLTEIISVPTHKGIGYKDFVSSLLKYANTKQRFGK